mmetsp:Transcript_50421/g.146596  ORF Transcript_50421/g.146596 Transcript_50421/m.146596 type:complete len:216 (-) Transcript_50421:640-1287(-)
MPTVRLVSSTVRSTGRLVSSTGPRSTVSSTSIQPCAGCWRSPAFQVASACCWKCGRGSVGSWVAGRDRGRGRAVSCVAGRVQSPYGLGAAVTSEWVAVSRAVWGVCGASGTAKQKITGPSVQAPASTLDGKAVCNGRMKIRAFAHLTVGSCGAQGGTSGVASLGGEVSSGIGGVAAASPAVPKAEPPCNGVTTSPLLWGPPGASPAGQPPVASEL